jgi:hypothetical protein
MGDGHCPRLDPQQWDGRFWEWREKPFYRATYWCVLGIPLNLDSVVEKAMTDIRGYGLTADPLIILSRDETMFHSSLLIAINKETDQLPVETISGSFYSRLYEGRYADKRRHNEDIKADLRERELTAKELYHYHATCPACVQERGSAQTVIFARLK